MKKKKLIVIEHRINTIEQLRKVPNHRGVEVDIRDYADDLQLAHDPFLTGDTLDEFLREYRHRFIIFNVKCDGIENYILKLVRKYNIQDYFFLDVALPTMVCLINAGERNIAVRFSEYEPLEFVLSFRGLVDWVWVDCFNRLPLNKKNYKLLSNDFKICLVSPELQQHRLKAITEYQRLLTGIPVDAVCTDEPSRWE